MDVTKFTDLLDKYGVPLCILTLVSWAVIRSAKTVWSDLVIPFRDRLIGRVVQFFDKLDLTLDAAIVRDAQVAHSQQEQVNMSVKTYQLLEDIRDLDSQIFAICNRLEAAVTGISSIRQRRRRGPRTNDQLQAEQLPPGSQ